MIPSTSRDQFKKEAITSTDLGVLTETRSGVAWYGVGFAALNVCRFAIFVQLCIRDLEALEV